MKFLKKFLIIAGITFVGTSCIVSAEAKQSVNTDIAINCENGEIVVTGAFNSSDTERSSYKIMLATYSKDGVLLKTNLSEEREINEGTNTFSFKTDIDDTEQKVKAFVWTDDMVPICTSQEKTIRSLKVLAIGNSFSVDAMQWLYDIANSYGFDNIVLGDAYIGGCTLERHSRNSVNDSMDYTYYKNTTGTWVTTDGKNLSYCIQDEDWDLITLQQASGSSGIPDTYDPYLTKLINYVNNTKTNPDAKLAWHMTWSYAKDSNHAEYYKYSKNQLKMYNAIISTVKTKILTNDKIKFVIPAGTAIQNVRTSAIGDTLNRDGYHLDLVLGRYIAGLTWFSKITGIPIEDVSYVPNASAIPNHYLDIVKECVTNAINNPYMITQSQYDKFEIIQ